MPRRFSEPVSEQETDVLDAYLRAHEGQQVKLVDMAAAIGDDSLYSTATHRTKRDWMRNPRYTLTLLYMASNHTWLVTARAEHKRTVAERFHKRAEGMAVSAAAASAKFAVEAAGTDLDADADAAMAHAMDVLRALRREGVAHGH